MKILLDENLARKLVEALRNERHEVESLQTLRMQGLDNGRLYRFAIENFDLFFTRDFGFANNVRQRSRPTNFIEHLIDQPVLDVESSRESAFQAAHQGFEWRRIGEGIESHSLEKFLCLGGKWSALELLRVLFACRVNARL